MPEIERVSRGVLDADSRGKRRDYFRQVRQGFSQRPEKRLPQALACVGGVPAPRDIPCRGLGYLSQAASLFLVGLDEVAREARSSERSQPQLLLLEMIERSRAPERGT